MTVVLTGRDLGLEDVVRVAREGERVEVSPEAVGGMEASRRVVEGTLERGEEVYGLTTGVGALKRVHLDPRGIAGHQRRLLETHAVGQGPAAPGEVVRAAMLCLANQIASGVPAVRPIVAERVVGALNEGRVPPVRVLGSIGQSDLAAMAELALGIVADVELVAGEGLALVNSSALSTGWAALALSDARRLLEALEVAAAVSLEGFAANLGCIDHAVAEVRPYPGLARVVHRLRALLEGSGLWEPGRARNLQDPLSFRCSPQLLGAAWDAMAFALDQLAIELNASQGNPIVVAGEGRVVSAGNFDVLPLALALDLARIALASPLTAAAERTVKLLEEPWSGLPTGLVAADRADSGLSIIGITAVALAAEARSLAHPVSYEVVSTSVAEGIEDRMTMAPLGARRLAEMVSLGERIVAGELVVGAQAAGIRGGSKLGRGSQEALGLIRERVPLARPGGSIPSDLEPLVQLVRTGRLSSIAPPARPSGPE